jgi:hypothetical protein
MLIELKRSDSNSPVWINPNHVVTVFPYAEDANVTMLRLVDGEQYGVKGEAKDIVKTLAK